MKRLFQGKNTFIVFGAFVFLLFFMIGYATPLQGDDWGYALNGRAGNPWILALQFYQSWSGRFFSELWGFLIAPRRWLWVWLNALLFAFIYMGLYHLGKIRKHPILTAMLLLAGMLSVDDHLRMETYTWIMGTTYVIPLAISIGYFGIIDGLFQEDFSTRCRQWWAWGITPFLFVAGLMMENISFSLLFASLVLLIYSHFYKLRMRKYFMVYFLAMLLAFALLRLSPGASLRLYRDSGEWANLSLLQKMIGAYPNFLERTFLQNDYAIAFFALTLGSSLLFCKKTLPLWKRIGLLLFQMLALFTVFSFVVVGKDNFLMSGHSVYSMIFWPLYVVMSFVSISLVLEEEYYRNKTLFLLAFAGINAVVMLASPIYGARSSIYTVFYLLEVSILVFDNLPLPKVFVSLFAMLFMVVLVDRTMEYTQKYYEVSLAEKERQEILHYYRQHPEVEEAWIPRFPIYTTHGSDIEPDDIYHLETFKEYYHLPQDKEKIIFFFKES